MGEFYNPGTLIHTAINEERKGKSKWPCGRYRYRFPD